MFKNKWKLKPMIVSVEKYEDYDFCRNFNDSNKKRSYAVLYSLFTSKMYAKITEYELEEKTHIVVEIKEAFQDTFTFEEKDLEDTSSSTFNTEKLKVSSLKRVKWVEKVDIFTFERTLFSRFPEVVHYKDFSDKKAFMNSLISCSNSGCLHFYDSYSKYKFLDSIKFSTDMWFSPLLFIKLKFRCFEKTKILMNAKIKNKIKKLISEEK